MHDYEAIIESFCAIHKGRSIDWCLSDDAMIEHFAEELDRRQVQLPVDQALWQLLNYRKAGKLGKGLTTKRTQFKHDSYEFAAEIAARQIEDEAGKTLDQCLTEQLFRNKFDEYASRYCTGISSQQLRLAALALRKKKSLQPEDFKKLGIEPEVSTGISASDLAANRDLIPPLPGIYIFTCQKNGMLYIGEALNLKIRVSKHIDFSDRKSLAHYFFENGTAKAIVYFHTFPQDSTKAKTKKFRTAYERMLIRSRKPKYNIQGAE